MVPNALCHPGRMAPFLLTLCIAAQAPAAPLETPGAAVQSPETPQATAAPAGVAESGDDVEETVPPAPYGVPHAEVDRGLLGKPHAARVEAGS